MIIPDANKDNEEMDEMDAAIERRLQRISKQQQVNFGLHRSVGVSKDARSRAAMPTVSLPSGTVRRPIEQFDLALHIDRRLLAASSHELEVEEEGIQLSVGACELVRG